jgi:putative transposase
MAHIKTYKYRLKLTLAQKRKVDSWIHTCRAVYNLALDTKIYAYKSHKVNLSKFDLIKQLPDLKKHHPWVKEVPAQTLQAVIERMDTAYQSFFRGGGFPRFARKDRYNSVLFKSVRKETQNRVVLPKIGSVKFFDSRPLEGELRNATITRVNSKYYIRIVTKQEECSMLLTLNDSQVGVDMGISFWASLSNGTQIENPKHTQKYEDQLRVENRKLSRKAKGSNNRKKQRKVVSKLHAKIRNVRKDFLHKQSTSLIQAFGLIAVEDLRIKNMVRFGNLSKAISDTGWGEFFTMLKYKAEWYGREFVRVDPKYTSQTCNACGVVDKMSRLSQSKFVCTSCGCESNADINAANNILDRAKSNLR